MAEQQSNQFPTGITCPAYDFYTAFFDDIIVKFYIY